MTDSLHKMGEEGGVADALASLSYCPRCDERVSVHRYTEDNLPGIVVIDTRSWHPEAVLSDGTRKVIDTDLCRICDIPIEASEIAFWATRRSREGEQAFRQRIAR